MRINSAKSYSNKNVIFYLFALSVSVYILTFSDMQPTDVGCLRIEVARSIVERLDISVTSGMGISGIAGRDYSWFGIGSVLLTLPLYVCSKMLEVPPASLVNLIHPLFDAATVSLIFLFCSCLGYSRRSSILVSIFYGFGTMALYYSKDSGDHVLETFFVLLTFFGGYRFITSEKFRYIIISGSSLGIAFLIRSNSIILILPLLLMLGVRYIKYKDDLHAALRLMSKAVMLLSCSAMPFVCIYLWYNYCRFGSIFETGYTLMASRMGINYFIGTPLATGLFGLLASPGKGFFFYSPITILFFFSIREFWKKHPELASCFINTIVLYILFYAKYIYWHGDWAWGPRYLLVLIPFFIIPIAEIFNKPSWAKNTLVKIVIYTLFVFSILIQLTAVSVSTYSYFIYLDKVKHITFTVDKGIGVQPVNKPPIESYFNWRLSPILVHAQMSYVMTFNFFKYKYTDKAITAGSDMNSIPEMNILDYWWIYLYFTHQSYIGFFTVPILIIYIVFNAIKLRDISSA